MLNTASASTRWVFGLLGSSLLSSTVFAEQAGSGLEEIVVTAQRRSENLSDVPISVAAYSREKLDLQGVRAIDDVARLTPGVVFARSDARNGAASNISIRGISSTAGTATTGIYIDDTPIQVRSLGYSSFNSFPQVFDLERVEILRGPQGTLFGAGSQGGTVRFITPQPSLERWSSYVRSEVAHTDGGDPSYEAGAAIGGPIVDDRLAFRVSGWLRQDGGWVDRADWNRATLQPTNVVDDNANSSDAVVARAAVTFAPNESLSITPSIYYQQQELDDTPAYWTVLSDTGDGRFYGGNAFAASSEDRFYLPALKIDWNLGPVTLISSTSYFNRENHALNDYTGFESGIWAGNPYFPPGIRATAYQSNWQSNLTQEVRLQSNDEQATVSWVVGAFFSHARQTAAQRVENIYLPDLILARFGVPLEVVFGQGLLEGRYTAVNEPIISRDEQIAVFGQADWKVTDRFTVTLGLRASKTKVEASGTFRGPVVGPDVVDSGSQEEEPVTPKLGVSYRLDDDNLLYATAAKGFRIGGFNPRVGLPCNPQLASLGLTRAAPLYDSDSVWSYEVGSKNSLLDQRLRLSSSVFYIDWTNIQQTVTLSQCGFNFVANLGSATSKGADLQLELAAGDNFTIGLSVGYTDAEFDETVKGGPGATSNLVSKGDHIVGSPWTGAASIQYDFTLVDRDAYARLDYQYQSGQTDRVTSTNPANGGYDPIFQVPQTDFLTLRTGLRWSGFDVSLFVNNLLDADTTLSRSGFPTPTQSTTFRPRTFGVTGSYRY